MTAVSITVLHLNVKHNTAELINVRQREPDFLNYHHRHHSLTCLTLNARSILNKIDLLKTTVVNLDPDIIGITESWCTAAVADEE